MVIHLFLSSISAILYQNASSKQPGYIPQNQQNQSTTIDQNDTIQSNSSNQQKCAICKIIRPIRTKHCYDCKRCVATYDHHCIWLDNCVAQKNRHIFFLCILSHVISLFYTFATLISNMWKKGQKQTNQIVFLSFLFILLSGIFILLLMHCYLMSKNMTTWQLLRWKKIKYLKNYDKSGGSPFNKGIKENILNYWKISCDAKLHKWDMDIQSQCSSI